MGACSYHTEISTLEHCRHDAKSVNTDVTTNPALLAPHVISLCSKSKVLAADYPCPAALPPWPLALGPGDGLGVVKCEPVRVRLESACLLPTFHSRYENLCGFGTSWSSSAARELQAVQGKLTQNQIDPLASPATGRLSVSNWLSPPPPPPPPPPRSVRHTVQDARRLVYCCCCCCCCVLLLILLNKPKIFRLSSSHRIGERRSRHTSSSDAICLCPRMSSRFGYRVRLQQRFPPPRMPRWETIYDRYPSPRPPA